MLIHLARSLPVLASLSLLLTVERGLGQERPPSASTPGVQISVRNSGPLPEGCAPEETAEFLTTFLDAFNRGDTGGLSQSFPREVAYPDTDKRGFQWYSVTDESGHFVTYDPADLPAYFKKRHLQHEELQLLELEVAASWHAGVDIVFRLSRRADDLTPHEMTGKGAIYCDDNTIFVWSMAQDMPVSGDEARDP
jgi:hypothetical protein